MSETFDLFDPPPDGDATPDATADVPGTAPTAASRVAAPDQDGVPDGVPDGVSAAVSRDAVPDHDGVPVGACRDTPLRGKPLDAGVAPPRTAASPDAASPDGDLGVAERRDAVGIGRRGIGRRFPT